MPIDDVYRIMVNYCHSIRFCYNVSIEQRSNNEQKRKGIPTGRSQ